MADLVKRVSNQSLVPIREELAAYREIAQVWVDSGMLPKHVNTPEKALATMLAARDLGLKITAAFKGLYVVNGKVQMEGWVALGLIQGRIPTFDYEILKNTDEEAEVKGRRSPNHQWVSGYYSLRMAALAGLTQQNKEGYTKNPADMLFSKALLRMCRRVASDILYGLAYDEDEMKVMGNESPATLSADPDLVLDNSVDGTYIDVSATHNEEKVEDDRT